MSARVYKYPYHCRRKMIFQPARLRWYCKTCGKLMPHREQVPPAPVPESAPTLLTDPWGGDWLMG